MSSDEEQVQFQDLSFDDRYEIFQFLPITKMVIFRRVSKEWAELLDILLLKQKSFGIKDPESGDLCKQHDIGDRNCLPMVYFYSMPKGEKDRIYEGVKSIVQKCPNLKAVYMISDDDEKDKGVAFGNTFKLILENCDKLECVKFKYHTVRNGSFGSYTKSHSVLQPIWYAMAVKFSRLKHISLPYLTDNYLEVLLRRNKEIKHLALDFFQENGKSFKALPSSVQSIAFSPYFKDNAFFDSNSSQFMNLQQSSIARSLTKLTLWTMPSSGLDLFINLKTLIIGTPCSDYMFIETQLCVLRQLIYLEELQIVNQGIRNPYEDGMYIRWEQLAYSIPKIDDVFDEMFSSRLQKLNLHHVIVGNKALLKLPALCPVLRSLELTFIWKSHRSCPELNVETFLCFASISSLTHVVICRDNCITKESLIEYLKIRSVGGGMVYLNLDMCENWLISEDTFLACRLLNSAQKPRFVFVFDGIEAVY
jgi:hypothetical protein